jgi:putative transposase
LPLSNGEFIENPRFLRQDEKALKKAQRKLAAQKRGSRKRRKAKKVVARIHERIANRRHDFVHQVARKIVNGFGFIAVEKLNVKNMSQRPAAKQDEETGEYLPNGHAAKAGLNKSILDAAWSMFRSVLSSKAESAGREVVNVNPAYTSQDCYGCGYRAKKGLSQRWHFCPRCGLSLDRDSNAALNILQNAVGLHSVVGIPA